MVRTGGTIAASVKMLAENPACAPEKIFFYSTHYICPEARENLNSPYLTQFITTNTIPNVLNRDDQGRLRKKTVVLKLNPGSVMLFNIVWNTGKTRMKFMIPPVLDMRMDFTVTFLQEPDF